MRQRKRDARSPLVPPRRSAPSPTDHRRPAILVAVLCVLLAVAGIWWARSGEDAASTLPRSPPADDPRLTIATPFLNVRPDVKYVGDGACADCHRDVSDNYHRHPMGRS